MAAGITCLDSKKPLNSRERRNQVVARLMGRVHRFVLPN
jgi:hypothetical protein